jgi:rhodanese-related sulfurtransferase
MRHPVLRTLLEAALVVVVGAGGGLAFNAGSGKGLTVNKNHFAVRSPARPDATTSPAAAPDASATSPKASGQPAAVPATLPGPEAALTAELVAQGYQVMAHDAVVALQSSPQYALEQVVLVDARADEPYQEGHIPGAYQLDHYRVDQYLPEVLPVCQAAETIVVYCNGGECEDSKLAVNDLMAAGIQPTRMHVYLGGITAWKNHQMPMERGARGSQDIVASSPEAP